jgi:uncharacterized phiE125 gp8 family phage protein
MALRLSTAPTEEPVTLAEARGHLRVPSADTTQDALLQGILIPAAREHCESWTHRRFITQTWELTLDCFPGWQIELPNAPLQSVPSITYVDAAGATQTLAGSGYQADARSEPGRLMPACGAVWPSTRGDTCNAVTITFVCGYGLAAKVPRPLKSAILLTLAHLYRNREANSDFKLHDMPFGVPELLSPYRLVRF